MANRELDASLPASLDYVFFFFFIPTVLSFSLPAMGGRRTLFVSTRFLDRAVPMDLFYRFLVSLLSFYWDVLVTPYLSLKRKRQSKTKEEKTLLRS